MVEVRYKSLKLRERSPDIGQRELARGLGISLGKTSYCPRALAGTGWVKTDNFCNSRSKLAYAYLLTPQGMRRKAEIALHFLQRKMDGLEAIKQEIEELQRELAERSATFGRLSD